MDERYELFQTAFDYLKRLMRGIDCILEDLERNPSKHMATLADAVDGLGWLAGALSSISEDTGHNPDVPALKEQLFEISSAIENSDFSYLSEFLENETMPLLCDWYDALEEFEEKNSPEE